MKKMSASIPALLMILTVLPLSGEVEEKSMVVAAGMW